MSPRALLCLSSLALAACGGSTSSLSPGSDGGPPADTGTSGEGGPKGDGGSSGGDGGSGISAAQAASDAAMAYCTRAQACAPAYVTFGFGDVATCESRLGQQLASSIGAPGSSSTPSQIEACAQALPQASCADLLSRKMPAACMPIPGTLANGAACGTSSQCVSTRCSVPANALCGTCAVLAAAGASCAADDDCQPGMKCLGGACVVYGDPGAACSATQPCRPDLGCVSGSCATALALGAACSSSDECDQLHGIFCNPNTMKCDNVAFAAAGGACGLVNSTLTACAGPGSLCSGASMAPYRGTCVGFAKDGASCDADAGPLCDVTAVCVSGTCQVPDPASCH